MKAFSLLFLDKQMNKLTNQMYLKSWVYKEGFFSIIIASRMQCILLKGSQLSCSEGVLCQKHCKNKHGMELYKSRVVCCGSVLLSKLMMLRCHSCTPLQGGSPAVLSCIHGADNCGASVLPCLGNREEGKKQGVQGKRESWSQLLRWNKKEEGLRMRSTE